MEMNKNFKYDARYTSSQNDCSYQCSLTSDILCPVIASLNLQSTFTSSING